MLDQLGRLTGARVTGGNAARLLADGEQTLAAVLAAIEGAERFVTVSAHVFWGDVAVDAGRALATRAAAGVGCYVLLDGLQSVKTDRALLRCMRRADVHVQRVREPWRHPLQLNRRLHRASVVVDARTAIVGGVGLGDDWCPARRARPFRDRDLALQGPVVDDILGSFAEEWLEACGELPGPEVAYNGTGETALPGQTRMLALRSRAGTGSSPLERGLRVVLRSARERVDLASAYFVAPQSIRDELVSAAARGVHVRVLVPGERSNRPATRRAARALYGRLLRAGVSIHEYRPAMLHAKSLVVDGRLCAVGSANLDNRSLRLDDELVAFADDPALAGELTRELETDVRHSDQLTLAVWRSRSWPERTLARGTLLLRRDF